MIFTLITYRIPRWGKSHNFLWADIHWGPFFARFFLRKSKQKEHSRIKEEKMTKISDFVFFIWIIVYLLIFVWTIKYSMNVFNKQNPTYLKFYWKSGSYNWNQWVTNFFALKALFLQRPFFARFLTLFRCKKGPLYRRIKIHALGFFKIVQAACLNQVMKLYHISYMQYI